MIVSRIVASFKANDYPATERAGRAAEAIDRELADAERSRDAAAAKAEALEQDLAKLEVAANEAQAVLERAADQVTRLQRQFDDAYETWLDVAGEMNSGDPYDPAFVSEYGAS